MSFDCVLNFIITWKSKEDVVGRFYISYAKGDKHLSSKDEMWSSYLTRFPPSLGEFCIEVDGEKICPQRYSIWEQTVAYKEVTDEWIHNSGAGQGDKNE